MKLESLAILILSYLSLEIVLRRWLWHQLPTQISPTLVVALLVLNVAFISWRLVRRPTLFWGSWKRKS